MSEPKIHRRRTWIALVLGIASLPAGYLYAGQLKRGFLATCIWLTLAPAFLILICRISLPPTAMRGLFVMCTLCPLLFLVDICMITRKTTPTRLKPFQRWWFYLLAIVVTTFITEAVINVSRSHIAEAFIVPGRAMAPTINHNDRIIVDKLWFDASKLQRNDLAVFMSNNSQLHVMRIVGLPGETIEISDEKLFIDGIEIDDKRAHFTMEHYPQVPEMVNYGPETIPERNYFVLGDNRRRAKDSRIDGPIPFDDFRAVAKVVYWSNDYTFFHQYQTPPRCGKIRWDRIGLRLDQK